MAQEHWAEGMVVDTAADDAWDDTEILQAFDAAVKSYRQQSGMTRSTANKRKRKDNTDVDKKELFMARCEDYALDEQQLHEEATETEQQRCNVHNSSQACSSSVEDADTSYIQGYTASSFGSLAPPLVVHPEDPELQAALAEVMQAMYQSGYATGKYQTLLNIRMSKQT